MMGWIAQHRQALSDTLRRVWRAPAATLFTVFAIGVALSLPAGLYVVLANLASLAGNLPARPELSIYMKTEAGEKNAAVIRRALKAHKGIETARFVPRDEALKQLSLAQGLTDVTENLSSNPLPDAWIVTPRDISPAALEALQAELARLPQVEHVRLDSQWARRLDAFLGLGRALVATLSLFLAMALVAISGNTIRMQILTRHDEIEVSRLIGATDRYIRRPFLYSGALLGAAGGLAALLLLGLAHLLLRPSVARLAEQYALHFQMLGLSRFDMATLLIASTLLGWVGAHFAVTRALARL